MSGVAGRVPEADAFLAQTRVQFLTAGPVDQGGVRDSILASWWRSRHSNVAADRLELRYVRDPNLDTPLTRCAEPVLRHLSDLLDGQPLSMVLTDATGVVLSRMTGDLALERELDRVQLAPGFSYAEQFVGTNGIGTALEAGRPMHVFGHEHYAENLEELACAGVPIRHPVSGKTVGALDLTCWRRDAGPLLVTLAKTTAEQIRQALLTETGLRELELLHEYLRACHRSPGMVFALNNDVVMMNETARTELSPADQAALLGHAAEALAGKRESCTVELPTGMRVRMHTHPVRGDAGPAGGVVDVKVVELGAAVPEQGSSPRMLLPALIGTGALWRRACAEAEAVYRSGEWLVMQGEQGTGKLAVLRAVHQRVDPAGHFAVLDGAASGDRQWLTAAREALRAPGGAVVVRHLEALDAISLRALSDALRDVAHRDGEDDDRPRAWVAVCLRDTEPEPELARLLRSFPSTVQVPPLRHHIEDVQQLVPFLLRRLGQGQLSCAPETMQLLLRAQWPGNVEQLLGVLRGIGRLRRTGAIQPGDLPPEIGVVSRRRLTPLESMERDAIVRALVDARGNKADAARCLGVSRATIYRKVHDYGIVAT